MLAWGIKLVFELRLQKADDTFHLEFSGSFWRAEEYLEQLSVSS